MSEMTAIRIDANLPARRSPGPAPARGRVARDSAAGTAPAAPSRRPGSDDRGPAPRPGGPRAEPPPRAAMARSAAARLRRSMSPRFQATRTPPGARSGNASSTSSPSPPTARATTAGQRPRCRASAASASARTGAASTDPSRPVAATTAARNAAFLRDGSDQQRACGRERGGQRHARDSRRRTRCPGTGRRPRSRRTGIAVRLSTTWASATAAGSRIAVRLIAVVQASSSRAWPSMAVLAAGVEGQAERVEAGIEGVVIRGRERRESPRRASGAARAARPRHAFLMVRVPSIHARRSRRRHRFRTTGAASVFPDPSGSRPGFPEPLADRVTLLRPQCGCRTLAVSRSRRQRALSTDLSRRRTIRG